MSRLLRLSHLAPYGYIFVIVAVILLFGRRIMRFIETTLFRRLHSPAETNARINNVLQEAQNKGHLCELTTSLLAENLKVQKVAIYICDPVSHMYHRQSLHSDPDEAPPILEPEHALVAWFQDSHQTQPFICDEVIHRMRFREPSRPANEHTQQVLHDMTALGYESCVPVMLKETLDGLLFIGAKKNRRPLTNTDIHVLRNITHAFTLWLQRFKMLDRVRNLEQYATLGEMAASIAHEVKNPLAIIRSSAQLYSDQTPDESLSIIIDECDRLNRTITQILQFCKASTTSPARIDLAQYLNSYVAELNTSPQFKNIDIQIDPADTIPSIRFDRDHLKQIVMNIMLNAAEALSGRGRIALSIRGSASDRISLVIQDDGPGITPDIQEKMYDPFYSTKPGGTGLGLPITHKLLQLNDASMNIVSRPGTGCTVTIQFPCYKE
jgi:signal transduction histidine kinase